MNQPRPVGYFADLLPYASTETQKRWLEAIIENGGSLAATAVALGIKRQSLQNALATIRQRAERETVGDIVPVGQRVSGKSTLVTPEGTSGWTKTERAPEEPDDQPVQPPGFAVEGISTMQGRQGETLARWTRVKPEKVEQWRAFERACEEVSARYAGQAPTTSAPALPHDAEDWLNVVAIGDHHLGMLAWAPETGSHHDTRIGVHDLRTAMDLVLDDFRPAGVGLLAQLGDFFHAQDDRQVTPGHGHKLDVDGRWNKVVTEGLALLVHCTLRMLDTHARVIVDNRPGNHDEDAARMIAIYLRGYFRNEPRVEVVDNANPYWAMKFGENLIATCHGDGCKRDEIPGLFAAEFPELWGGTTHRRCYSGHIHHEVVKAYRGMTVENFPILPGADAWHHRKGYGAERSLNGVSHHKRYGLRRRSRIDISMVRDAQAGALR